MFILSVISMLLIFWIALTQSFSLPDILLGVFVSILSIYLSKNVRTSNIPLKKYSLLKTLKYIMILLINIFISAYKSLKIIMSGKMEVKIVRVSSVLEQSFALYVLAMSITLTPGTITLYRVNNTLYVLRLYPQGQNEEEESIAIKSPFEQLLLEG